MMTMPLLPPPSYRFEFFETEYAPATRIANFSLLELINDTDESLSEGYIWITISIDDVAGNEDDQIAIPLVLTNGISAGETIPIRFDFTEVYFNPAASGSFRIAAVFTPTIPTSGFLSDVALATTVGPAFDVDAIALSAGALYSDGPIDSADIAIDGDRLYIAYSGPGRSAVALVDVTDPTAPEVLTEDVRDGSERSPYNVTEILLSGDTLYVGTDRSFSTPDTHLSVYDVSNPNALPAPTEHTLLREAGSSALLFGADELAINDTGDRLYVLSHQGFYTDLYVYNTAALSANAVESIAGVYDRNSDIVFVPNTPDFLILTEWSDAIGSDHYVAINLADDTITVSDRTEVALANAAGQYISRFGTQAVVVDDLFTNLDSASLLNIADPTVPVVLDTWEMSGKPLFTGDHVYTDRGQVRSITNPDVVAGSYAFGFPSFNSLAIAVEGDRVYVVHGVALDATPSLPAAGALLLSILDRSDFEAGTITVDRVFNTVVPSQTPSLRRIDMKQAGPHRTFAPSFVR